MTKIINHIYDTTTVTNLSFIQTVEIHPWNVLRALKARLAPSDSARSLKLEQQYNRMAKGPSNRQNIDAWLDDYLKMLALAKQAKIAEITDSKRAYRDFLHAIEEVAPIFAEVYELQLEIVTNHETQLLALIEIFRHHMRMKEARRGKETISNSAFAADSQSQERCYCGRIHFYGNCYYINEKIRPEGWTMKSEIVAKIDEAKKNPKKKRQMDESIKLTNEKRQKKDENKNDNKGTETEVGSFASFTNGSDYYLRSSWILDHGFGTHVANKTMKQRFQKERDCTDGFMVMSGMKSLPILAYGRIRLNVSTPKGKSTMELLNVCYVSDFMVNIVADSILEDKGVHFNTEHRHLYRKGSQTPLVLVPRVGAHYVLEDNRSESEGVGTFAAIVRKGTTNDAIQHLQQAAEGVELTNKDKVPLTNKCEASESALMLTPPNTPAKTNPKSSLPDTPKAKPAGRTASEPATITTTAEPTPKKPISWAEIASRSIVSPKPSSLPIPSPKSVSKALENAPLTSPPTPPQKSAQMQPKPTKQSCLTVDDLHRMFAGKPKPLDLQQHQNHRFSPHTFGIRQRGLIQTRITSTSHRRNPINQGAWITKNAKTSKTRSLHQCMIRSNARPEYS